MTVKLLVDKGGEVSKCDEVIQLTTLHPVIQYIVSIFDTTLIAWTITSICCYCGR